MPDEFTPEASVDFEALAAAAAEMTNGNGPHYAPPPPVTEQPARPRTTPPPPTATGALDPFQALAKLTADHELFFREFGEIQARMRALQLQAVVAVGSALLLAVLAWKIAKDTG